jgi:ribosomal protein L33
MTGSLNKLPIAIFGMIFFDELVTVTGVVSIFIGNFTIKLNSAFGAGIIYSIAKSRNNNNTKTSLPKYSNNDLPKYSKVGKTELVIEDINDEEDFYSKAK